MLTVILHILSDALPAWACAVCGNLGEDPAAGAILAGTGLLSVAPILTIGGGIYYVYRKTKLDQGSAGDSSRADGSGGSDGDDNVDVVPPQSVLPAAD
ncbi:MAG: hypothetical protein FJ146_13335 [Deltaproteobacteria bacterium]|nr:hypothetical protein [Deltaproteobacteria bacterium]